MSKAIQPKRTPRTCWNIGGRIKCPFVGIQFDVKGDAQLTSSMRARDVELLTAVTTSSPFYTLAFAVTGRMIGGKQVNRQSVTREEALTAHTRHNAFILFQEANLGVLAPGKYADLLVLDRDYLTVPEDKIKDLKQNYAGAMAHSLFLATIRLPLVKLLAPMMEPVRPLEKTAAIIICIASPNMLLIGEGVM